jgi:hypothetical protein
MVGVGWGNGRPTTNQQDEEEDEGPEEDEEAGGGFLLEETDPLFRDSNVMEVDKEEPIFVLELAVAVEERAAARRFSFPNGNGACDAAMSTAIFPMWSWIPSLSSIPFLSTDNVVHPPVEEIHFFNGHQTMLGFLVRYPRIFKKRFDFSAIIPDNIEIENWAKNNLWVYCFF